MFSIRKELKFCKFCKELRSICIFLDTDVFLLTVSATDQDDPTSFNGQLEYNIDSGNIGGVFAINETTGVFSTSSSASFDFQERNNFTVIVSILTNMNKKIAEKQTASTRNCTHVPEILMYGGLTFSQTSPSFYISAVEVF